MQTYQVTEAIERIVNQACDDVLEALEPLPDTGVRDVVNLLANVIAYRLQHPDGTVKEAIEEQYGETPSLVLGYCAT